MKNVICVYSEKLTKGILNVKSLEEIAWNNYSISYIEVIDVMTRVWKWMEKTSVK